MTRDNRINCKSCAKVYPPERENQNDIQVNRGCFDTAKTKFKLLHGDKLDRCPVRLISHDTLVFLNLYNYYRNGYLPLPGNILQQPNKLLDAFSIITMIDNEIDQIKEKKKNKKYAKPTAIEKLLNKGK